MAEGDRVMLKKLNRGLVYLLFVVSLAALLMALSSGWLQNAYMNVFLNSSNIRYSLLSANKAGVYWALGRRNSECVLSCGRLGRSVEKNIWGSEIDLDTNDKVLRFFVCSDGKLMMVIQKQDDTGVYLVSRDDEKMTRLLTLKPGETASIFAENDSSVTFVVDDGRSEAVWEYEVGYSWLVQKTKQPRSGPLAILAIPGGSVLRQENAIGFVNGGDIEYSNDSANTGYYWYTPETLWLLDSKSGEVRREPLATQETTLFTLSEAQKTCGSAIIDLNISEGGVLLLTEDNGLYCWTGSRTGFENISESLLQAKGLSIAIVVCSVLLVLLLALIPWYLVCEYQRMHISIVFRSGIFLLLTITLLASLIYQLVAKPYYRGITDDWARQVLQAAGRAPDVEDGVFGTMRFTLDKETGNWYQEENGRQTAVIESLMYGGRFNEGPGLAVSGQESLVVYYDNSSLRIAYFIKVTDDEVIVMTMDDAIYSQKYQKGCRESLMATVPFCFIVWLLVLFVLMDYSDRIQRVANGLNSIESGHTNCRVVDNFGDEISSLADSVNTMAELLEKGRKNDVSMRSGYAAFLPDQLISLLNVQNVEQIDRSTFERSERAMLHVKLVFDKSVYEDSSHRLFDYMNEVIGRTAEHISENDGIILSFSYDGYDAVFPPDGTSAVSAVVSIRQEALAINEEHRRRGLSEMKLQATLDVGELMAGVVGSSTRMQVVALSSSLNRARMLSSLFERLDANVLCTEKIAMQAEGFHNRYIGRLCNSAEEVRVYELYEGDDSALRTEKEEHAKLFAEGVYLFYAGDFSKAKRIFMNIVRTTPRDGVARHYLYLADRFEKEPPEKLGLDS